MRSRFRAGVVASLALLAPSAAAHAQRTDTTVVRLDSTRVTANRDASGMSSATALARTSSSIRAERARTLGIGTTAGLVSAMPYAGVRSGRGDALLSLRGARTEQTVVTLDEVPLNDPATGVADVADLPLIAIEAATITLGADPMGAGPGASGGVLSLHTATRRAASLRTGAFGERRAEVAGGTLARGAFLHGGLSWATVENDFPFLNDAGAGDAPVRERRVNADERRVAAVATLAGTRTSAVLLGSTSERGMVGPANVRAYDADRARTDRLLVRARRAFGDVQVVGGARAFALSYRDPTRPVLDSRADAGVADLEVRGPLAVRWLTGGASWRAGGGADRVRGTGGLSQARGRAFAAVQGTHVLRGAAVQAGARIDAVGAAGTLPSFSLAAERRVAGVRERRAVHVGARLAQAVRVPTLYDLYFSSPQRLSVRALRPERVTMDAELNARASLRADDRWLAEAGGALVARDTRDAIVWFPGNFGWSPANVGAERLRGAEVRASLSHESVRGTQTLGAWLTAYDPELRTGALRIPTPYVPRIAAGAQLVLQRGAAVLSARSRLQGRRPFTAGPRDPAYELPAVHLLDASLGHRGRIGHVATLATLALDNATDVAWQSVRGFPSPGRSWAISLTLTPASTR
jgi:outer membrane cobalamin receptor